MMDGAEVVAKILQLEGTEFLTCYPRNPLIDACARLDIRTILSRQERVAVGIADGYSRLHRGRRIGVFAPQSGPGIENAFPGIAQAYSENVPLLIVTGGSAPERRDIRPTFSAVDNCRGVTKWATQVTDIKQLPKTLRRAYHMMRNGKMGPVLLEIPESVWSATFEGPLNYTPTRNFRYAPDPADVAAAAKLLRGAKAPVIFAGQGILYADATAALVELAELLNAPVLTTNPGKSAFPETHPLSLGGAAVSAPKPLKDFLNAADVVFAVGSSLTTTPFGPNMPAGKRVIHAVNDPEDINKDVAAEIGLIGDAGLVLDALLAALRQDGAKKPELRRDVRAAKEAWLAEWKPQLTSSEMPINQYRVIADLMKTVDRDNTIITHDSGSPREQLLPFWECTVPQSYIGWGKSTQLGHGLGLIMGAKLAAPDKLCINVMGDSAIGMVGMDLETAARNGIAILTIVFNNGVMAAERHTLVTATAKYGAYLVGGNYQKLAEALGVQSFRVERPDDFVAAVTKAIAVTKTGAPALVECIVKEGYDFSRS
jgi:acetolactate synthase I/II/III large subunit